MEQSHKKLKIENSDSESKNNAKVITIKYQFDLFKHKQMIKDGWLKSTKVSLKGISEIKFWIEAQIDTITKNRIMIRIRKSSPKKSIAVIKVEMDDISEDTNYVVDWGNLFDFTDFWIPPGFDEENDNNHKRKITVTCSIYWYGFIEDLYYPNMCNHMSCFYKDKESSDMVIKIKDNKYPAHKLIVIRHSSVFQKMLTDSKEAEENVIDLPETGVDIMEELLLFFYKGKMVRAEFNDKIALKLFKFANEYKVDKLKTTCEYILLKHLNIHNAVCIHDEATIFGSVMLQQCSISCISRLSAEIMDLAELRNDINKLELEYKFKFNDKNECLKSTKFSLKEIPNIDFWIEAKVNDATNKVDLRIGQNSMKKSIAIIIVQTNNGNEHTERVVDWTDYVDFDNVCEDNRSKVNVHCIIRWHGFVEYFNYQNMCGILKSFYKNEETSDMLIKIEGAEFSAHKLIVTNQSPVFYKMLTSDSKEAKENFIYLPDTDSDMVKEMLLFFYKGEMVKAEKDYKIALKLLRFANMYQIEKLKATCEFILVSNLDIDNVFTIRSEAEICHSVMLQQHAIQFIYENVIEMIDKVAI